MSNKKALECTSKKKVSAEQDGSVWDEKCKQKKKKEKVEDDVLCLYKLNTKPILNRCEHVRFLKNSLTHLSGSYEGLDCSRPWLCYWILHSLQILDERLDDQSYVNIIKFLAKCQAPHGGFGGGQHQFPHLASTYAAVNALCIIGTKEAYRVIHRRELARFLTSLLRKDGSFSMHSGGEADIRGVYCAVAVAKLTNIFTPEMFGETEKWIQKCQTWEGGFGGCPGMEAHGGYAFCGLASLVLLGKTDACDLPSLLQWIVKKQMQLEGGFQGRTNKLVDGCYSFWQGGAFPLIHAIFAKQNKICEPKVWLFDQAALQEYLLVCCQHTHGGFLDKPGKSRDVYHTCYDLSGLSIAQNSPLPLIIGPDYINSVEPIHPLYNLAISSAQEGLTYFGSLPLPDFILG
ncbi:protein farnesyltransferase subunit beta [Belonocnema kinseyi]|uniref:protein farnesyltransferase subunit beta n=1 Tax=Belonocnema kinseyi TaxID=2817044 RepID=UPI00143CF6B6|nr:protein farnesyltransferase subunit beta [Belonocnema kinseyi]